MTPTKPPTASAAPPAKTVPFLAAWIALAATILTAHPAPAASAEPLVIQGSSTFSRRLMEPFQRIIETTSGVSVRIIPNKSLNGLIALLEGRADLAMTSAPLAVEIDALSGRFDRAMLDSLKAHLIDNTRVAFAVHPSNPVRKASLEALRAVLLGKIDNWRDLGGPDLPIRVVFVGNAGGVTQTVQTSLLGGTQIAATHRVPMTFSHQVVKVVEQEPGALGLCQIKLLAASSLPDLHTEETIEQQLFLVSKGEPSPAARALIDTARLIAARRLAKSEP
jgi:phosphate transport system substrate-binding protein